MKKSKLSGLSLNKRSISNFSINSIRGGSSHMSACCQVQSLGACEEEPLTTKFTDCDCH